MRATSPRVLVTGAGIGGLTAALALLKKGFDVEVHEQASELKELGAGLQLGPNGTRVLAALGLEDAMARVAAEPTGKEIHLWSTGQSWKLFDLGTASRERYGAPYLMMHRADLHALLAEAVRREKCDAIRLGSRCVGFRQSERGGGGGGVALELASGETVSGEALVGADGVHSQIRCALFGPDEPRFTGCMAWRGLVATDCLPERIARPVGVNWVGPGGHVVHYPLRRGEILNFVGIIERDDWRVESWTARGTREECAADFRGWHDDVHEIIRRIDEPYKWALMGRAPLARWSIGRVTLLGDACHPMLPFLAQGANMAIEDGFVLARCLEAADGDAEVAFARYERVRIERTTKAVLGSTENARRFHSSVLLNADDAERYVAEEWHDDRVYQRYHWLFDYDATTALI